MTKEERIQAHVEEMKRVERQLKGVIPRTLSEEEGRELLEWLKENKKNMACFKNMLTL